MSTLTLLTTFAGPASGFATSGDTLNLSLEDAILLGRQRSEEILIAKSVAEGASDQVGSARSELFPQVGANLNYIRTLRSPSINVSGGSTVPSNAWVAELSVQQTLFTGGRIASGIRIAKEGLKQSEARVVETELDYTLQVIEAYSNSVLADRLVDIIAASVEETDAQLLQARRTFAAGNSSELELLRVDVERQNLEPDRVASLNDRELALLNLKRLVNIPFNVPVRLTDTLSTATFRPVPAAFVDGIASAALEKRPSLIAAGHDVEIEEQRVRQARSAYWPTIGVSATLGEQAFPSGAFPAFDDFQDNWSVGAGIQIPIFNGGDRRARLNLAKRNREQARLELARARESVQLEVEQARGEMERAEALIGARSRTVEQALRVYQLTDLAYRQGVATSLQLSDSRLQLRNARANEARALHDYYLALIRLERSAGRPVSLAALRTIMGTDGGSR